MEHFQSPGTGSLGSWGMEVRGVGLADVKICNLLCPGRRAGLEKSWISHHSFTINHLYSTETWAKALDHAGC